MTDHKKRYIAFEKYFKPLWIKLVPELISMYDLKKFEIQNMLDIGFGYGILTKMLSTDLQSKNTYAISTDSDVISFLKSENLCQQIHFDFMNIKQTFFKDNFFDFIFSRGSYRFWDDKERSFNEIYRIMKKDSIALIGGGFGSQNTKKEVKEARLLINKASNDSKTEGSVPYPTREELSDLISKAGFENFDFTKEDFPGMWIHLKK